MHLFFLPIKPEEVKKRDLILVISFLSLWTSHDGAQEVGWAEVEVKGDEGWEAVTAVVMEVRR